MNTGILRIKNRPGPSIFLCRFLSRVNRNLSKLVPIRRVMERRQLIVAHPQSRNCIPQKNRCGQASHATKSRSTHTPSRRSRIEISRLVLARSPTHSENYSPSSFHISRAELRFPVLAHNLHQPEKLSFSTTRRSRNLPINSFRSASNHAADFLPVFGAEVVWGAGLVVGSAKEQRLSGMTKG